MKSNYIETLDYLLKIKAEKKKKEPTQIEQDQFFAAWVKLATVDGYSEQVEKYLYNGVTYCGAKPLKAYIDQVEDKHKAIMAFFNGKLYGANADTTFRLLSHLLALLLNDKKTAPLASVIIMRFPSACLNKDKKRLGKVEQNLLKYFFSELDPNMTLIPLNELNIKQVFITEFVESMETALGNISTDGLSKNKISGIKKVKKWIEAYQNSQCSTPNSVQQEKNDVVASVKTATSARVVAPTPSTPFTKSPTVDVDYPKAETSPLTVESTISNGRGADLLALLGELEKIVYSIKNESIQQKNKIDTLTSVLAAEREKLRLTNSQIADQNDTITNLRKKIAALEGDIFALKQDIAQRDTIIAEKNAEISERIQMANVLSLDRTKQVDEALQRLASKIRIEYRDFLDAVDAPMSSDLGENLRLQLQSVFDILEKGGMKIK